MSVVAEQKKNWLEEVKADAEALTRKRLAEDLPKMEQEMAVREAKKKEANENGAGVEVKHAEAQPTQPVGSDGQPDQGEMKSADSEGSSDSEELAKLKAENRALKSKNTKLENKLGNKTAPDGEETPEGDKPEGEPKDPKSEGDEKEGKK